MSDTFKLVPLVAAFLSVSVFASTDKISLSDLPELKPDRKSVV